ncbi:MAG: hypothetical protein WBM83_10735 [Flavobacteriaceae bacterium]
MLTKNISFEVVRGETVKITGLIMNNFPNKDNTWDDEFLESDPEHLADVFFLFKKIGYFGMNFTEDDPSERDWYFSDIKKNQGDLTWNLADKDLYIPIYRSLYVYAADDDAPDTPQDFFFDTDFRGIINFSEHQNTKPSTISFVDEQVGFDITVMVEWP